VPAYEFIFKRKTSHTYYLLALKLLGGINEKSEMMMRDKAMIILEGGKLSGKKFREMFL
jgi:hypothetical protein